jgi:hypothetical protein
MKHGKSLRRFFVIYFLVLVLLFAMPGNIHRHEFDRAFSAWHKNPNPITEAELRHQQRLNELQMAEGNVVIGLVVVGIGYLAVGGCRVTVRYVKKIHARKNLKTVD